MNELATTSARVERARRRFVEEGILPGAEAPIAAHVVRSWDRSFQRGAGRSVMDPVSRADLADRREAASALWRCAQPELDALAEQVMAQKCVVILSDASGLILDEAGSTDFLPKAERVALLPGVDWSESQRGTNAIGTALAERDPVLILGPEHFLDQNTALGCAAAPILTARGELAGVLDISGEAMRVDEHALSLARMAAAQVEHRLMNRYDQGELVRFHWRPALIGTAREGLLAVADGRIVGLNRVAASLLGQGWSTWLDRPIEQLFAEHWARLRDRTGLMAAPDGRQWAVRVDAARAPAARRVTTLDASPAPRCDPIAPLLDRARRVLDAGLAVLVSGETGTGKDWFARRLHAASRRAGGPLVTLNCAALPETLIEAELFGYEEGAFTGARRRGMKGRLREADGGVLFLDEIGDMPLALQTRLLRVLEDRMVRPLGGTRDVAVDFRLVAATHRDLPAMVKEGRFREDLLYRLNGFLVELPALRHRADRRALVVELFQQRGGAARGLVLADDALDAMARLEWRGNVRELIAVIDGLVALADDGATLGAADLPARWGTTPPRAPEPVAMAPSDASTSLAMLEQQAVRAALAQHRGRIAPAARSLGVHRSTLYRWLQRERGASEDDA